MDGVFARGGTAALQTRLLYFAWRRYRIPEEPAEDIVQAALVTFLEVRARYRNPVEHPKILVGIFRNKCREYIGNEVRAAKGLRALKSVARTGVADVPTLPPEASPEGGVLADLIGQEDGSIILAALAELRPSAREMFRLIVEKGATRADLAERYGINKNTLDSRLHTYRREFRALLARRGVKI